MKKLLLLISTVISSSVFSQSSILLTDNGTSMTLTPNATINAVTTANNNTKVTIDIKNTSGVSHSYSAKRYDIQLNAVGGTTASAYFCFAGTCYGDNVIVSPNPLTLSSGQSASQVPGSYQMLVSDLDEASAVGVSIVKYTFINTVTNSDSVQITIKYNAPVGLNEASNNIASLDFSPNPVNDLATIKVNCVKASEAKMYVYNALGAVISEKNISLSEGKNKIDFNTETYSSGVYFVSLKSGASVLTKKFVVR
jgi:Secretion system C-terminal sorting domain